MRPEIIVEDYKGRHNTGDYVRRLEAEGLYKDRSTVCIVPSRGVVPAKVVQNWMGMMVPMNQKFARIFMIGMEVGAAYEQAIEHILANPELSTWKYVFTLEEDNMVPPDVLMKLYTAMDEGYDAVGALYWTKGEGGQPMCYGNPLQAPLNFIPQIPQPETVTRCNGLGMGATLFKMELFKEGKIERPFFKTVQSYDPAKGCAGFTQDLWFFNNAAKAGYKFACDSRAKVGHYDINTDIVW
jgi:hypothetical protein